MKVYSVRLVAVGMILVATTCMTQSRTVIERSIGDIAVDNTTVTNSETGYDTEVISTLTNQNTTNSTEERFNYNSTNDEEENWQKPGGRSRDIEAEAAFQRNIGLQLDSEAAQRSSAGTGLLYPYGDAEGDSRHPQSDDSCQNKYTENVVVFGETKSEIYICTNGVLSLDQSYSGFTPNPFPLDSGVALIAPYWADGNFNLGGRLYHRKTTDAALLEHVSNRVRASYGAFSAEWLLITTWSDVRAYGSGSNSPELNTFQCVLAVSGVETYAIYLYDTIVWTYGTASSGIPAQVGFDSGDGFNYYAIPESQSAAIVNVTKMTNNGEPGVMIYKLSDLVISPPPATSCEAYGNTYKIVAGTGCAQFTQETEYLSAETHTCSPGTTFDVSLCVCNWPRDMTCPF